MNTFLILYWHEYYRNYFNITCFGRYTYTSRVCHFLNMLRVILDWNDKPHTHQPPWARTQHPLPGISMWALQSPQFLEAVPICGELQQSLRTVQQCLRFQSYITTNYIFLFAQQVHTQSVTVMFLNIFSIFQFATATNI